MLKTLLKCYGLSAIITFFIIVISLFAFNTNGATFGKQTSPDYCLSSFQKFLNLFIPDKWEYKCPEIFGASITADFPTSYNNFIEGDTIEEEDFNQLEYVMGTSTGTYSSSSVTSTLFYRLTNSAQVNPGHLHSSSSISGNWPGASGTTIVANGGTATTTFARGLVTASGTNAFASLAPTANGQIPISGTSTWVTNTLTAGDNITITNGSGTITIAGTNGGWSLLASSTYSGAATIVSSTAFTAKKYMKIVITTGVRSASAAINGRLNRTLGADWASRRSENGGADATGSGQNQFIVLPAGTSTVSTIWLVTNESGLPRYVHYTAIGGNSGQIPDRAEGSAVWYNTSTAVTFAELELDSGTFAAGSVIFRIFGSED